MIRHPPRLEPHAVLSPRRVTQLISPRRETQREKNVLPGTPASGGVLNVTLSRFGCAWLWLATLSAEVHPDHGGCDALHSVRMEIAQHWAKSQNEQRDREKAKTPWNSAACRA